MENNEIIKIWEAGNDGLLKKEKLMKSEIRNDIQPGIGRTSQILYMNVCVYSLVQLANIILLSINIPGYKSNSTMMMVISTLLVSSVYLLFHGLYILHKYRLTEATSGSLLEVLEKIITFFKRSYEVWLILASLSALIFPMALIILISNIDGVCRINNPWLLAGIMLGVFCFIYLLQKLSHYFLIRQLKIYLADLHDQMIEVSEEIHRARTKYFWLRLLIILILIASIAVITIRKIFL